MVCRRELPAPPFGGKVLTLGARTDHKDRTKVFVFRASAVLFILAICAPLVQSVLPPGPMVAKDKIVAWSVGLGQIAFGLVAAFLVFFLPDVTAAGRALKEWQERLLFYRHSSAFDQPKAFRDFVKTLAAVTEQQHEWVPSGASAWTTSAQLAASGALDGESAQRHLTQAVRHLHALVISPHRWALLEQRGQTTDGATEWQELRGYLLASFCTAELTRCQRSLTTGLGWLAFVNLVFGALSIAPDPFLFVNVQSLLAWKYPLPEDYVYPELSMWVTAIIYMVAMFLFAVWFSLENETVHLYRPDIFDIHEPESQA
jgi:hypothetical protein